MKTYCQHCGTVCPPHDPYQGFCCPGCCEVYALIHDAGLENYYALQDRAGRPVDTPDGANPAKQLSLERIQARTEAVDDGFRAVLYVSGMTCRGCAWLIERIATRMPGLRTVAVSLTSGRIELVWRGNFDFDRFQLELRRFGYALSDVGFAGLSLSPLSLRFILSSLFSANGICFLLLREFSVGGTSLYGLYQLSLLVNLILIALVGSTVFFRPAWDAIRIRQWHSDIPVALLHSLGLLFSLCEIMIQQKDPVFAVSFMLLVPAFLLARQLADHFELSSQGREVIVDTPRYD
ncbi:MAG: heavy metal translocating P-type ATPase metal-binding domain-containing protein [Opitutales bacterium]